MAAAAHSFDSPVVNIKRSSIPVPYLPLWRSILIEQNLCKFVTILSRNVGFEKFLSLYQNLRYQTMDIHWEATFFYLNDDEDSSHTSFYASTVKANHIKHMFKELPTLERMKLRRPDLYKDWNCPTCKNFPETFAHVWSCQQHLPMI